MTAQLTFLFTDIEASTRAWERHPDDMSLALARHDEAIQQAVKGAGGKVFKHTGDGVCAVFATAATALGAALAAQQVLQGDQWQAAPLRVRMALHSGAAERRGGDYFGPPLNRTARLLDTAHGGQVVVSLVTAELLRDELPPGTELFDLGEHRLTDLARPERVFQVTQPGLAGSFPPLRSLGVHRHNLPVAPSSFIGRDGELAAVGDLLRSSRLVTLSGVGGVGKTRLALQVAADLVAAHPDGAFLVELAPLTDGSSVVLEVTRTLGLVEAVQSTEAAIDRLGAWLRPRRLLLLLDNCEHVVDSVAVVAESVLRRCPDVVMLTTSREPLAITGEVVWRVPSLGLPGAVDLDALAASDAVRLFCERARAADATFELTAGSAPAVARICRRLDGIPLALELAAARIRVLGPEQIADRLDDRFHFLGAGSRTAPRRQQTLRAAMDWSYDLLSEPERLLLQRLSVFAGSFDLEACEAVAADGADLAASEVFELVAHLVDKSLVVVDTSDRDVRYRLLETVQQYAGEHLAASGHEPATRRRHLAHFVALTDRIFIDPPAEWMTRSKVEDDLRAALDWSLAAGDVEASLRLACPLGYYWAMAGRLAEGRARLEQVLGLDPTVPSVARGRATNTLGFLLSVQGDFERSMALHEEALALALAFGDPYDASLAGYMLATRVLHGGDPERAEQILSENTYQPFEALDSPVYAGWCEYLLGWIDLTRGDEDRARERFERAVECARPGTGDNLAAHALASLAPLAALAGEVERAVTLADEGMEMARRFGLFTPRMMTLTRACEVGILLGHWDRAEADLRESLALLRDSGGSAFLADSLEMAGLLRAVRGAHGPAVRLFSAAQVRREAAGESADARSITPELERYRTRAAHALADFDAEWAHGARLSPEAAIAYALEQLDAPAAAPSRPAIRAVTPATLRREGTRWRVGYGPASFELADMKGLHHLARLLSRPGDEIHVLDLTGRPAGEAGPVLDEQAKREYARRVRDLQAEIEESESWNDPERTARARLELEALTRQLAAAVGLGGRDRPSASAAERARVSVRKAVAKAIAHISDHDADLALLLSTTVRTGRYCSYVPDPRLPVVWSL